MLGVTLCGLSAVAATSPVDLGSAGGFAVLGNTTVTSTGFTVISGGNLGLSPGTSITGFPPAIVIPPYGIDAADAAAAQAQVDLHAAYNDALGRVANHDLTGQNLGGQILTPGTYFFASSSQLTGTLTLNDQGDPNAVFIFQIGSTLTTAANSAVVAINGGPGVDPDIFFQVGSSATLGVGSAFEGNILADQSITLDTGAAIDGRLLALNGAVTLDNNRVSVPLFVSGPGVPDKSVTFFLLAVLTGGLFVSKQCQPRPVLVPS